MLPVNASVEAAVGQATCLARGDYHVHADRAAGPGLRGDQHPTYPTADAVAYALAFTNAYARATRAYTRPDARPYSDAYTRANAYARAIAYARAAQLLGELRSQVGEREQAHWHGDVPVRMLSGDPLGQYRR